MARMEPKDYLAEAGISSESALYQTSSALVRAEMEKLFTAATTNTPIAATNAITSSQYEKVLPPPPSSSSSVAAWEKAIKEAQIAVEAQGIRSINLELMNKYGVAAWKTHITELEALNTQSKQGLTAVTNEIESVNALRQSTQQSIAKPKLKTLSRKYTEAVEMNLQTEVACGDIEAEVKRLRRLVTEKQQQQQQQNEEGKSTKKSEVVIGAGGGGGGDSDI